jgi:hypothetical protein
MPTTFVRRLLVRFAERNSRCDTSLRTTPARCQLVRDRWSNRLAEAKGYEGWNWIRDTQLNEDAHR